MASTYVNDLRIEEQATGENSGTWGTKVNSAFSQIAEAFSYGTKQLAADANETFTMPDGTSDGTRSLYLKITSAGSLTATRTVTLGPNTVSKLWIIENATTGSQSITIAQGSGGTVTIPTGAVKMVYSDGAGSGAAVVDALTDVYLASVDHAAFGDNKKAVFGAGSDLQIYHNGSDSFITDNGTGDLKISGEAQIKLGSVGGEFYATFNNNSSVNLYYDNAQKLATTSTGIDVTGTVTADGANIDGTGSTSSEQLLTLVNAGGDAGAGSRIWISGTNSTTRGAYIEGQAQSTGNDHDLIFATSATSAAPVERMRIDSRGVLGVNAVPKAWDSAFSSVMQVGAMSVLTSGGDNGRLFSNAYYDGGATYKRINTGYAHAYEQSSGTHRWYIGSGGSAAADSTFTWDEAMRIDANKHLNIGVSSAIGTSSNTSDGFTFAASSGYAWLSVSDTGGIYVQRQNDNKFFSFYKSTTPVGTIGTVGTDLYIGSGGAGVRFYESDSSIIPCSDAGVASNGNIDLGDGSFRFKDLYLSGNLNSSSTGSLHSQIQSSGGDAKLSLVCSDSHDAWVNFSGATNEMSFGYDRTDSAIKFCNADTLAANERMRLTSTGTLIVNATDSVSTNDGFRVFPAGSGTGTMANAYNGGNGTALLTGRNTDGTVVAIYRGTSSVGSISVSSSATAYNTSSDQRLKENIVDAPSASDDIDAIQVRSFDWKADGSHQKYGMVAQELVTVAPEAVTQPEDPEEMMGVDYSKLVPMMLKEIQQLRARVAHLEGAN